MKMRNFEHDLYEVSLALAKAERAKADAVKEHNEAIKTLRLERDQLLTAIESGQMQLGDDVGDKDEA